MKEEFGFVYVMFGMPLRHISYILKKIRNIDLYELIFYQSQFNRKPTISLNHTVVGFPYLTVNPKMRSDQFHCAANYVKTYVLSLPCFFCLVQFSLVQFFFSFWSPSGYKLAALFLFYTHILSKREMGERTMIKSETKYCQLHPQKKDNF